MDRSAFNRRQNHFRSMALMFCISMIAILPLDRLNAEEIEATADSDLAEITELSLEELMSMEVTSVSKRSQKLSEAPAAVFVITQEDIRRSGATHVAELLRMVPGMQVARLDSNKWAVSSRGFADRFANKLLVLVDGRSVYTPMFSGVYWNMQDLAMEDVERIEVIRGPGATMWGANAVNGVINIITKKTADTQGVKATAGYGTEERGFGSVRYGGHYEDLADYRVWAQYHNRGGGVNMLGKDMRDDWETLSSGFRMDMQQSAADALTIQGNVSAGDCGEIIPRKLVVPPYSYTNNERIRYVESNMLGRWTRALQADSALSLQLYWDKFERESSILDIYQDTIDIDFQHNFRLNDRNEIIWGLAYRYTYEDTDPTFDTALIPEQRKQSLYSGFIQNHSAIIAERLSLTVGSKFEVNDYTGLEIQPSVRLAWTPDACYSVWGAVSRAVRTPSRGEHDAWLTSVVYAPGTYDPTITIPLAIMAYGNHAIESEELIAYEIGVRACPVERLGLDIALFYNDYDNLRTQEIIPITIQDSTIAPHLVIPVTARNNMYGYTYGMEVVADWRLYDWWKMQLAYTNTQMMLKYRRTASLLDTTSRHADGNTPHNQISLRSNMDLPHNIELDLWLRYVDDLRKQPTIDAYTTMDVRIGWRIRDNLELSLVGQNLFQNHRAEFDSNFLGTVSTEVEKSIYGKITWHM